MTVQHGGDIYRNEIDLDFSTSINPLGMPECGRAAVSSALSRIGQYPDIRGRQLCKAIAVAEGISEECVFVGNGAVELIYGLCYGIRPKKVLSLAPAFSEYEQAVVASGGSMEFSYLKEEDDFQVKDFYIGNRDLDMIFLCNPNNPTGAVMEREQLLDIAGQCEKNGTWLCVDECFLPFLHEEAYTMKREIERFPHLLVLRAFTKVYGMPGLRLGYVLTANQGIMERLESCLPPWNTSVIAQAAGIAVLEDKGFLERTRNVVWQEREYLLGELNGGLAKRVYTPTANFIFFSGRPDLYRELLEKKVLIRDCSNFRGLEPKYFRIAVRSHRENEQLIRRWQSLDEKGRE
ncbi:MAG: aminotransferase class I/II-fold pyridoxal phosphate-dependent enzyme [Lachnospiraceae bacterium]|nr:aminotransferase class I/II-fold pyridoxal phosphate-dependent enzyme [Lachnospiraceae bacterium]